MIDFKQILDTHQKTNLRDKQSSTLTAVIGFKSVHDQHDYSESIGLAKDREPMMNIANALGISEGEIVSEFARIGCDIRAVKLAENVFRVRSKSWAIQIMNDIDMDDSGLFPAVSSNKLPWDD